MLFASVTGNDEYYDGARLVASEDGGSTWNDVDGAIYTAGQVVTSYTAIHGTTSLYAISVPQDTPSGQEAPSVLWSSADAGANWKRVGPAPLALAEMTGTTSPLAVRRSMRLGYRPWKALSTSAVAGCNRLAKVRCLSSPVVTAAANGCGCPAPAGRNTR